MIEQKQVQTGYLPPKFRWVLEETILGAILLDRSAMPRVHDYLVPANFVGLADGELDYLRLQVTTATEAAKRKQVPHAWLYQTMLELYESSQKIDVVTVTQRVQQKWCVNAAVQISNLTDRVASTENLQTHALKLVQDTMAYELIGILERAIIDTRHRPDGEDDYNALNEMCQSIRAGYDPIEMAIRCHDYCKRYGMPTVASQLQQYSELAERKLRQMREHTRSHNLTQRLTEAITANVVNQQALMCLRSIAEYLSGLKTNADSEVIEKLYELKRLTQ